MDDKLEEYDLNVLSCLMVILQKITAEVTMLDSNENNGEHLLSLVTSSGEIVEQINKIKYGYINEEL